jgi:hypothetical protein
MNRGTRRAPPEDLPALVRRFRELALRSLGRADGATRYPGATAPGADALEMQRLFEAWLKRDHWRLREEALPLLAGVDPAHWRELPADAELAAAADAVCSSLTGETGVERRRVASAHPVAQPAFEATPAALYHWAHARGVALPGAFEQLMQFILSTVKRTPAPDSLPAVEARAAEDRARETVLGAALGVLARWPERCRGEDGAVSPDRIVALLEQHAVRWFDAPAPPLARAEVIGLLERWL